MNSGRFLTLVLIMCSVSCGASQAKPVSTPVARVDSIAIRQDSRSVHVLILTTGHSKYRSFVLSDPRRLVLDLYNTVLHASTPQRDSAAGDPLVSLSAGQSTTDGVENTRFVLEIANGAVPTVIPSKSGIVIRVELEPQPANVAEETGTPRRSIARILYMTSSNVYLDAGRADYLRVGDALEVIRDGKVIAQLQVEYVSSRSSMCVPSKATVELAVGDKVRLMPRSEDTQAAGTAQLSLSTAAPVNIAARERRRRNVGWLRQNGIRGRIGARYLSVRNEGSAQQSFSQPALDLRIEGTNIGASPLDVSVDVRARKTYRVSGDGSESEEGRSKVYRASATWHPQESGFRLSVGRQFSPDLPTISIFDGAAATLRLSHLSLGVLSGTQPDPEDYGYSTDIRETGAFLRVGTENKADRWFITVGGIGSYANGEINREFLSLQGSLSVPRFSTYVSQDLDLNRGWRKEAEGSDHTLTNTYVNSRYSVTNGLNLYVGFDNRRNVRLYRDEESPETEFDDTYRMGYWGGLTQRFGPRYRIGFDAKRSTGGAAGDADALTMTLGARWFSVRSTYYTNDVSTGWMHSGRLAVQMTSSLYVDIGGGKRDVGASGTGGDGSLEWVESTLDCSLGRHWYISLSAERSLQGIEATDQYYVTSHYRF